VADQIRRQIGLRLIPVGGALPTERELAAIFGVGRATVQHALRLLEADRLVESRRGRNGGTFVIGPADDSLAMDYLLLRLRRTREEIEDALVFRGWVEPAGAAAAAAGRDDAQLATIREAARRSAEATDDPTAIRYDTELHLAIAAASGNRLLTEAVERIRLVLNDALVALPATEIWQERTNAEHAGIVAAIDAGSESRARRAMEAHVRGTERSVRALLASL
jgi:DNA-binding FadR family transcriptional regulator